jgi:hypothetical protein
MHGSPPPSVDRRLRDSALLPPVDRSAAGFARRSCVPEKFDRRLGGRGRGRTMSGTKEVPQHARRTWSGSRQRSTTCAEPFGRLNRPGMNQ